MMAFDCQWLTYLLNLESNFNSGRCAFAAKLQRWYDYSKNNNNKQCFEIVILMERLFVMLCAIEETIVINSVVC